MRRLTLLPALFAFVAVFVFPQTRHLRISLAAPAASGTALTAVTATSPSGSPTAGTAPATVQPPLPTPAPPRAPPATSASASATGVPISESTPPQHYVVVFVIDGGRPSYLNFSNLPHIHALMQKGVVYTNAWAGQLDSATPDVHVTFGTGTLPRQNGFDGFGWAAPHSRLQVDFRTLLADGQIDPVLKRLPIPTIADQLHQFIPGSKVIAASGHKDYAVVGLGGGYADYELYGHFGNGQFKPASILGHAPPPLTKAQTKALTLKTPLAIGAEDNWAFSDVIDAVQKVHPRLLMLNLPETDTWGHWYGPDDTSMFDRIMTGIDNGIGRIEAEYKRLGILSKTDFIITADHGMMESKAALNWHRVLQAVQKTGDPQVRGDEESGGIWLKDPTRARMVANTLVKMHPQHVEAIFYRSAPGQSYTFDLASPKSWLAKGDVVNALSYLADTTAGVDGPDVWVLYREHYTVVSRNVRGQWKGTHGGATWNVQHVPLVISGPDVRAGAHSSFPARAIDLAPTIERLLGLPFVAQDGVVLADAFSDPMSGELAPEHAVAHQLTAYVSELKTQSQADSRTFRVRWPTSHQPGLPCFSKTKQVGPCKTTASTATNQ